jgi:hypothetical protein
MFHCLHTQFVAWTDDMLIFHLLLQVFLLNTLLLEDWFYHNILMHWSSKHWPYTLCVSSDHWPPLHTHLSSTPGAARRVTESDPCDSHSFRCVTSTRGVQFSVGHCVMRAIQVHVYMYLNSAYYAMYKASQACEWECFVVALCTTGQAVRTLSQVKSSQILFLKA